MASVVFPRCVQEQEGDVEREASLCSPRKSVQSDDTSSLAQLVTGTWGSPHLEEGGLGNPAFMADVVIEHPNHPYTSASTSKFEKAPGAQIYPYSGAWLRHPLSTENKSCRLGRRCGGVWKLRWLFAVSLLAFLSASALAYCVYLHGRLKHQDDEIEVILKAFQDSMVQHSDGGESGTIFETDFAKDRAKRDGSVRWFRSLIRGYLSEMPMIQLRGMDSQTTDWRDRHILLWQLQDNSGPGGFSYNRDAITLKYYEDAHNRIKGIQVHQTGVYLIYSQVVIEGLYGNISLGVRSDCTHETVKLDHQASNQIVLMKSYLTQDNHGRPTNDGTSTPRHPRDTSFHMGLFQLHRQDEIRVIAPNDNSECRLINVTSRDSDAAYFGLWRVG